MSDHARTPKPNTVRHAWAKAHPFPLTTDLKERYAEFERMIRAVRAEAWSEGVAWAAVECGAIKSEVGAFEAPGDNPYRDAS